jgi:hypothetical protein
MIRIIVHERVLGWEIHGLLEGFTTLIGEIDFVDWEFVNLRSSEAGLDNDEPVAHVQKTVLEATKEQFKRAVKG